MTDPIVRTDALGGSSLARAAMDGRVSDWYATRPASPGAWRLRAQSVRAGLKNPAWLDAVRPAITPSGAAAARLDRVANGRGVVVTTGQQPGLFGGPIYNWSKALSALAASCGWPIVAEPTALGISGSLIDIASTVPCCVPT